MAREFNLTPNALKEELDNLSKAGYLDKEQRGQSIFYKANTNHPFFPEINSIVKKHYGIDKIVEQILNDLGKVEGPDHKASLEPDELRPLNFYLFCHPGESRGPEGPKKTGYRLSPV